MSDFMTLLEEDFERRFDRLYWDLREVCPDGRFTWIYFMEKPPFWRIKSRRIHRDVVEVFAAHGFVLNDYLAEVFRQTPGQQLDEDAGGSVVRRLRQTFQHQTGIPYRGP